MTRGRIPMQGMTPAFLVVDRDAVFARAVVRMVRDCGFAATISAVSAVTDNELRAGGMLRGLIVDASDHRPEGLALVQRVQAAVPEIEVLVTTTTPSIAIISGCFALRAALIVKPLSDVDREGLRRWVMRVGPTSHLEHLKQFSRSHALTARQDQILLLASDGLGRDRIADRLGVSRNTLKWHVTGLLAKCGAGTLHAVIARARSTE